MTWSPEEFPHRAKLIERLKGQAAWARSKAEEVDPYSAKQLLRYAAAMDLQVETVETCGRYGR